MCSDARKTRSPIRLSFRALDASALLSAPPLCRRMLELSACPAAACMRPFTCAEECADKWRRHGPPVDPERDNCSEARRRDPLFTLTLANHLFMVSRGCSSTEGSAPLLLHCLNRCMKIAAASHTRLRASFPLSLFRILCRRSASGPLETSGARSTTHFRRDRFTKRAAESFWPPPHESGTAAQLALLTYFCGIAPDFSTV